MCQTAIVFLPSLAVTALSLSTSNASLMVIPLVLALGVSAPLIGKLLDKFLWDLRGASKYRKCMERTCLPSIHTEIEKIREQVQNIE